MAKNCSWPVTGLWSRGTSEGPEGFQTDSKWVQVIPMIIKDQFGTAHNLQRVLIPQTSNWSGTIFTVSYSKPALVKYIMKIWIQYSDLKYKIEVVVQYQIVMFVQLIFLIRWLKIHVCTFNIILHHNFSNLLVIRKTYKILIKFQFIHKISICILHILFYIFLYAISDWFRVVGFGGV